jgi:hypothetical protein
MQKAIRTANGLLRLCLAFYLLKSVTGLVIAMNSPITTCPHIPFQNLSRYSRSLLNNVIGASSKKEPLCIQLCACLTLR